MLNDAGATYGIGVLIDFHATNGSQNGFDHSAPFVVNGKGQQLWDSASQPTPGYPAQATAVIAALTARYGTSPPLLGFGLLNEPTVRAPDTQRRTACRSAIARLARML
jgi:aryl-phospho-beta-D-glucosidase BglC (GH1 family)